MSKASYDEGLPAGHVAWLFCPADRPMRFEKAAASADVVVLDLEDGVAPTDRPAARAALVATRLDPVHTVVRVNASGTPDHLADLRAVQEAGYLRVMLAKTENPTQAASLAPIQVIALCETPRGVLNALQIADCSAVSGMMWGAEDLTAALGGQSSRFNNGPRRGLYRDVAQHARSAVLLAAGAAGKFAIDSVYLDIHNLDGLAIEAAEAVQIGFDAKACIHPTQAEVVRAAFIPSTDQVSWASRLLAAAVDRPGVFQFEGQMIDPPVLSHARAILGRQVIIR